MKNARQLAGQINYRKSRSDAAQTTPTMETHRHSSPDVILLPSRILLEVLAVYCSCLCHIKYSFSHTEKTLCQGANGWVRNPVCLNARTEWVDVKEGEEGK